MTEIGIISVDSAAHCLWHVYPHLESCKKMSAPSVPSSLQSTWMPLKSSMSSWAPLGSSGLRVSAPILGTMGIGSKELQDWVMEEEEGLKTVKATWDRSKCYYLNDWRLARKMSGTWAEPLG